MQKTFARRLSSFVHVGVLRRAARESNRKPARRPMEISSAKASARASTVIAGRTISAPASAMGSVAGQNRAQQIDAPHGEEDAQSAAHQAQQQALAENLRDQTAATRAQRGPNPQLFARLVTRASNRLATFTQASSRSSPTAPSSNSIAGRMYSNSACFIPTTVTSQPASRGVWASMRRAIGAQFGLRLRECDVRVSGGR